MRSGGPLVVSFLRSLLDSSMLSFAVLGWRRKAASRVGCQAGVNEGLSVPFAEIAEPAQGYDSWEVKGMRRRLGIISRSQELVFDPARPPLVTTKADL